MFAGELCGSAFWGPYADHYGRRRAFLGGSCTIVCFGLLSALSPSYSALICFRFFVGFGVGGLFVPFDILAEFMPTKYRGQFLVQMNYFWSLGSMFVGGLAWLLLSNSGWRILTYITVIPVFLSCTLAAVYLPESPRWLMVEGRVKEAEEVIRNIGVVNNQHIEPFQLKKVENHERWLKLNDFFDQENIRLTIPLWISWFAFGFCYYGVILFSTTIFQKNNNDDDVLTCDFDYAPIFYAATSEIIGLYMLTWTIDSIGRVPTQIGCFLSVAIFVVLMSAKFNNDSTIIFALFARLFAISTNTVVWLTTPEFYPTEIRASGHAVASGMARFGALLSPFAAESNMLTTLGIGLVIALVDMIGCGASFFLPETKGKVGMRIYM